MTNKLKAAAQQALTALENFDYWLTRNTYIAGTGYEEAITALREALDHSGDSNEMVQPTVKESLTTQEQPEQAEQEPVAKLTSFHGGKVTFLNESQEYLQQGTLFYTHPVRTKDLTDEEIESCSHFSHNRYKFARAVIAAYKEKNK